MKTFKILFGIIVMMVGLSLKAKAAESIPSEVWNDIKSSSTMHILDNGTPGFFYDFADHRLMSGATTEIYQYRHLSFDFGLVKSIENEGKVIPVLGSNIHIGSFLNKLPPVHNLITNLKLDQGLLKYFVTGGWVGQDFTDDKTRYGLYTGFRAEFK